MLFQTILSLSAETIPENTYMTKATGNALISLILIFLTSCDWNNYSIDGRVSIGGLNGDTITLKRYLDEIEGDEQSVVVRKGKFELEGIVSEPYMAGIFHKGILVMPLVVEPGNIDVEITDVSAEASGTELNRAFFSYLRNVDEFNKEMTGISRMEARLIMDGMHPDSAKVRTKERFDKSHAELESYIETFIQEHYEDILGPLVFKQWFGQMYYPMSNRLFKKLLDEAPEAFKQDKAIKELLDPKIYI